MNRISLVVHVDPFADDCLYDKIVTVLEEMGSQIYSEPVVDRVIICKETDIDE